MVCYLHVLPFLLLSLILSASRLSWPWNRAWQMISWAILALLRLNGFIIHMHIGDSVYGHSTDLRLFLQKQDISFALAVPLMEVVCLETARGSRIMQVKSIASLVLNDKDWRRLKATEPAVRCLGLLPF